jgi:hypothetical protein
MEWEFVSGPGWPAAPLCPEGSTANAFKAPVCEATRAAAHRPPSNKSLLRVASKNVPVLSGDLSMKFATQTWLSF